MQRFQKNAIPDDLHEVEVLIADANIGLVHLLKQAGLVASTSDARRMIKQNAVKIDGRKVTDENMQVPKGEVHIYQVGKRKVVKIKINSSKA